MFVGGSNNWPATPARSYWRDEMDGRAGCKVVAKRCCCGCAAVAMGGRDNGTVWRRRRGLFKALSGEPAGGLAAIETAARVKIVQGLSLGKA